MSQDQINGIIRLAMGLTAGYAAKLGIDGGTLAWIVSGAVTLGTGAWTWYSNRPGKTIKAL